MESYPGINRALMREGRGVISGEDDGSCICAQGGLICAIINEEGRGEDCEKRQREDKS